MSTTSRLTRSSSSSPSSSSPSSAPARRDPALPAPGTWTIDPGHAQVAFVGRHMVLTKVRGNLSIVDGAIVVDDDPASSSVEVTIDMTSVQSGSEQRDEHLRSPDLFDVAAVFVAHRGNPIDAAVGPQVGAAHAGRREAQDGVGGFYNRWVGALLETHVAGAVKHGSLHGLSSSHKNGEGNG